MNSSIYYDVIIIGGGAAGLMAAWQASKRGKKTLLIEHTNKIGEKIRISGGGKCNFTNLHASHNNYISQNPHFVKSALANFSQHDFIKLIESFNIAYHEKTLGQLFCDGSSLQIIEMLISLCQSFDTEIKTNCIIHNIDKNEKFELNTSQGNFHSQSLIIASGGLSIPKIGASNFGYLIAEKFDLNIISTKPALVPLTLNKSIYQSLLDLSGISNASIVKFNNISFKENILFTHRGLSGPAILQISSYIPDYLNTEIIIDLLPEIDLNLEFMTNKNTKQIIANFLKNYFSKRLVDYLALNMNLNYSFADIKKEQLENIANQIHNFKIKIDDSEGYAKAEVTVGGIDTKELSSKTMEAKKVPGLFFIGEVVDVTGWLGGYNFQWAWSSGYAAGNNC